MKLKPTKIFCLGLSKTGTTSLAAALEILGYRTKDNLGVKNYIPGDLDSSIDITVIDSNDAFTDTPIPSFYQELDVRYPNSKFILTVRELNSWLKSCRKQFNQRATEILNDKKHDQLFMDIYNSSYFDEKKFTRGYHRFIDEARDYFKNRPDDLLVIDIVGGEDWEKLCSFLDKPIPDVPFPMSNVTQIQWINTDDLIAIAENAGQVLLKDQKKITPLKPNTGHDLLVLVSKFIHCDTKSLIDKAIKKSHHTIMRGLQKLTPNIPVLSSLNSDVSYSDRKSWNHVWLVDPLNGKDQYISGNDNYCLSFSLIQNGVPIMGVIYNPKRELVYYVKRGKSAYMKIRNSAPVKLEKHVTDNDIPKIVIFNQKQQNINAVVSYFKKTYPDLRLNIQTNPISNTMAFELIFNGEAGILFMAEPTKEWETAAAQSILKEMGKNLNDFDTKKENRYNKPNLINNRLVVQ